MGLIALLFVAFGLAAAAPAPATAAEAPRASAARVAGDGQRTRFVADLERPLSFSAYVVANPYRVILDLPDVNFQLPPGAGDKGRGLITGFRFGPLGPGKSRIIMDTKAPVLIDKAFIVPAENGQPARLVVDVVKTDAKTFARLSRNEQQNARAKVIPLPRSGLRTIILDPGHGGADPGATAVTGLFEKDLTLAFALQAKRELEKTGRYRVLLTRERDEFVSLTDRVRFARQAGGDLFIAIHADTVRGASVRGATIYTLSDTASDPEAAALAAKENGVDALGGVKLSDDTEIGNILVGLAQRDTANKSIAFGKRLANELQDSTELTRAPIRSASFVVLKSPDVPSVLVELGYLSDKADAALLNSEIWRARVAKSFTRAIDSYFATSLAQGQ